MRTFRAIFLRELFAFFVTPLAWVLIAVFLLVQGIHFYGLVNHFSSLGEAVTDQSPVSAFFGNTVLLYVVLFLLVPPLTMRLFAEERSSGTVEPLMTVPLNTAGLVLAKYCAALTTYLIMWIPTVLYIFILRRTGALDWSVVGASYLGVMLVGASYLAIGLLMSAATKSQFIALVLTALVILLFFLLGVFEFSTAEGSVAHAICNHVSVWAQMNDFSVGIVDSRRIVFDVTLIVVPLLATVKLVNSWRSRT
jgi:ABC-2 type transport system permease protein